MDMPPQYWRSSWKEWREKVPAAQLGENLQNTFLEGEKPSLRCKAQLPWFQKQDKRNGVVPGEFLDPNPWSRESGERPVATQRQSILVTVGRMEGLCLWVSPQQPIFSGWREVKPKLLYAEPWVPLSSGNMNAAQPTHANCKETFLPSLKSEHSERNQHRSLQRKQEERSKETGETNQQENVSTELDKLWLNISPWF